MPCQTWLMMSDATYYVLKQCLCTYVLHVYWLVVTSLLLGITFLSMWSNEHSIRAQKNIFLQTEAVFDSKLNDFQCSCTVYHQTRWLHILSSGSVDHYGGPLPFHSVSNASENVCLWRDMSTLVHWRFISLPSVCVHTLPDDNIRSQLVQCST